MTDHVLARHTVERYGLGRDDLVIEVGSGEGAFLQAVRQYGPRVLGVEADCTVIGRAFRAGIDTVEAEFTPDTAACLRRRYGPARVVMTRRDPADQTRFVAAASRCLTPDGIVLICTGSALVECRPLESTLPRAA
jgi:hypothetical protein